MKNKLKIILLFLLIIPIFIKANTYNYSNAVVQGNNYIKQTRFDKRKKYLLFDNPKFIMNDFGVLNTNSSFYNGGFLNKIEYCITTGKNDCKGSTYLIIPTSYWTLTGVTSNRWYVNNVNGITNQSDTNSSGVRVTEFARPGVIVDGTGKYSDPWTFENRYLVTIGVNSKKYAYFGSESDKKTTESKYATNECLSGSEPCANFDIIVSRGYGNNSKDGCNLKYIRNNGMRGTSVIKTYEISNVKSDIDCVAIFDYDKYNIHFDSNGGNGVMDKKIATYGKSISLPNSFTRTFYDFIGWNTKPDGSGVSWPTESFVFDSIAGEKGIDENNNLTLYAQWKLSVFTIAYDANGGSGAPESQTYTFSETETIALQTGKPQRADYTFVGWNTSNSATTASYLPGASFSRSIKGNTTLYAVWMHNSVAINTIEYTSCLSYTYTIDNPGYYRIEVWGAQGGSSYGGVGGKGGYSAGDIYLESGNTLYVYIGKQGGASNGNPEWIAGGCNGGGQGRACCDAQTASGGGATDVRLNGTGYKDRIIVAGGGGGAGHFWRNIYGTPNGTGGAGGGLTGEDGKQTRLACPSRGGKQTAGGVSDCRGSTPGGFGTGGGITSRGQNDGVPSCGGGGGWYGGSASWHNYGAAGGSSFISGYLGCVAVNSNGQPKCGSGNSVACATHFSGKVFTNTTMSRGVKSGNGKANITFLGP